MLTPHVRQVLRFDSDWKFNLGDIAPPLANTHLAAYMANKAGYARGAAKLNFDDSDWRSVDLPHDWSVEGTFDPENHLDAGFLPRGIAWYRRRFALDENDRGKRLLVHFDGVATHCTVYVNGHLLHRKFCGYTPFTIDITDIANFGDKLNCVAVRVNATYMEGWWYEGAGIYRHVWLIKTAPVHVAQYGTFVSPVTMSQQHWDTQIETTLQNHSDADAKCQLVSQLHDPAGQVVASVQGDVQIAARSSAVVKQNIPITDPKLWSLQSPHLYNVRSEVRCGDKVVDDYVTTFGYRTIRFDANEGFFLNDQPVKLLGTCNHQDHAGVGVAVPDSIQEFRIRRLLEMGSNAYRCAHNPPAPELLDACDRLGMLVMDENRNFGSSPQHAEQLRLMVLRDRNHPSVIMWSICNEEPLQTTPISASIARSMAQEIRKLDMSRPITAAVSGGILDDGNLIDELDVMGINYQLSTYDPFHAKHPNLPLVASETHCALTTRGTYETDPAKFVFDSYDTQKTQWGTLARETWRAVSSRPFVAGLFAWTGFDYRGEPSPHLWPCVNSHWGILDTCGFAKDSFFLHKAFFTTEPFVHLLPHWNWPGKEREAIRVMVVTNCESAELMLNGKSLGRKPVDPIDMAEWSVPYEPGELKAVAFREGQAVATAWAHTTGPAVAVGLEASASTIPADGEFAIPVTAFALDAAERRVPTVDDHVTFSISGPAKLLGVGNGDPSCHEPDKASARSLFRGLAQVILQTTTATGTITLAATAAGLKPATLLLHATQTTPRPSVPPAKHRHLVGDWRMSAITPQQPDVNQPVSDQDMNTWQRIDPANGAQPAWHHAAGFAMYRTTVKPPRILQAAGGVIHFHEVAGRAEFFINGSVVFSKTSKTPSSVTVPLPPGAASSAITVLLHCTAAAGGITKPVELLAADDGVT